jgi:hypothetical protein
MRIIILSLLGDKERAVTATDVSSLTSLRSQSGFLRRLVGVRLFEPGVTIKPPSSQRDQDDLNLEVDYRAF